MANLFAILHISGKENEFLPLNNINLEDKVYNLKQIIGEKVNLKPNLIETIYNGCALEDELLLKSTVNPNSIVHIFKKTKKPEKYTPNVNSHVQVQAMFTMISHLQITMNSRVNILQKIVAEYPEFRRNLGAQALIRDSVLFNTLQQPDVIKKVSEKYPIICEAAPFIVATIKKELANDVASNNYFSEMANDSSNSSEEENSLTNQSERAIRRITRHQLAAALQQAGPSSVNSLSNISQRNSNVNAPTNISAPSNGGISPSLFSNALARALDTISASITTDANNDASQSMDTSDVSGLNPNSNESDNELPATFREHQYAEQLRVMNQMGFTNFQENLTFLNITSGNIENAINLIMGAHDGSS